MGMKGVTSVIVSLKEREGIVRVVVEEVAGIVWLPAAGWEGLPAPGLVMALEVRRGSWERYPIPCKLN